MKTWFQRKQENKYPEFWEAYIQSISEDLPKLVSETTFIALDTETTGFDLKEDRILSIGALKIFNGRIDTGNTLELHLSQTHFNPKTVPIHGIINQPNYKTITEKEFIEQLLKYIGNAPIIAHHASFDISMINAALIRNNLPTLKNKVFDTMKFYKRGLITSNFIDRDRSYSLDEVAEKLNIALKDRHTAPGDAYITALIFLKLWRKWDKNRSLKTKSLLRLQ
ncbi:3'-5' exonuclease [Robertkochia marina]|uniref:3'-5' exonuclease n=1 Tax=Robertkochia marina TaxID=1227945 RepID=A0A4S3LZ70_9FLAO|nr:3'-5' exonuclease [Robertkochia marina]THD65509.1 3'-5' exonuclease [Robertkochia marina]TRZ40843.1 3'-5' exonuclease [Robertkochia marina]